MQRKRYTRQKYAFTLIELLIVIAVIAILLGIGFATFGEVKTRTQRATTINQIAQIYLALESYRVEKGFYPAPQADERISEHNTATPDPSSIMTQLKGFLTVNNDSFKNGVLCDSFGTPLVFMRAPNALPDTNFPDPAKSNLGNFMTHAIFIFSYGADGATSNSASHLWSDDPSTAKTSTSNANADNLYHRDG